jgi:hypothetical protein
VVANPTGLKGKPTLAGVRVTVEVGWYSNCQLPCQKSRHNVPQAQAPAATIATQAAINSQRAETVGGCADGAAAGLGRSFLRGMGLVRNPIRKDMAGQFYPNRASDEPHPLQRLMKALSRLRFAVGRIGFAVNT